MRAPCGGLVDVAGVVACSGGARGVVLVQPCRPAGERERAEKLPTADDGTRCPGVPVATGGETASAAVKRAPAAGFAFAFCSLVSRFAAELSPAGGYRRRNDQPDCRSRRP